MKRRTILLILMLAITIVPTVVFFGGLFIIAGVYLSNSGYVRVFMRGGTLVFYGEGGGSLSSAGVPLYAFVGSFISSIIFFMVLFQLIRGFQAERRKKEKMRASYTA